MIQFLVFWIVWISKRANASTTIFKIAEPPNFRLYPHRNIHLRDEISCSDIANYVKFLLKKVSFEKNTNPWSALIDLTSLRDIWTTYLITNMSIAMGIELDFRGSTIWKMVVIQRALCSPDRGEAFIYSQHVYKYYRKLFTQLWSQLICFKRGNT